MADWKVEEKATDNANMPTNTRTIEQQQAPRFHQTCFLILLGLRIAISSPEYTQDCLALSISDGDLVTSISAS